MQVLNQTMYSRYILKNVRFSHLLSKSFSQFIKYEDLIKLKPNTLRRYYLGQNVFPLIKMCHGGHSEYLKATSCGDLCREDVGKRVKLRGFLQFQRMGLFCILRDSSGLIQVLLNDKEISSLLAEAPYESYIEVVGDVILRPSHQINKAMKTGEIEVTAQELNILNKAKKDVPFLIRAHNEPSETLRLTYRYLDLRRAHLQENLQFRSKLGKRIRDFLQDKADFIEINTPTLSFRTPGGSQEFVVPSQFENRYYSLVQSPQTYKQLAIVGGIEKYFQFAVCYRDETGRSDRQPEFMQLDLEMANTTLTEIRNLFEEVLVQSWPSELSVPQTPFPSISYCEALELYGVDKPDTRFQWLIHDVTGIISKSDFLHFSPADGNVAKAFVIPGGQRHIKTKAVRHWEDVAKNEAGLGGVLVFQVLEDKALTGRGAKALSASLSAALIKDMEANLGDCIVLAFGPKPKVVKLLGKLRLMGADLLEKAGVTVREGASFNFLWVVDFPLFEMDEATQSLVSCHHPFTAPVPHHQDLLDMDPIKITSQHYDLVLNGVEIAGGSVRIHDAQTQKKVFNILGIEPSGPLSFFLDALNCGAPPHAGIALGFDRYISLLRGTKSIRDVMAFPKTAHGKCLMSGAPSPISEQDREIYHLK